MTSTTAALMMNITKVDNEMVKVNNETASQDIDNVKSIQSSASTALMVRLTGYTGEEVDMSANTTKKKAPEAVDRSNGSADVSVQDPSNIEAKDPHPNLTITSINLLGDKKTEKKEGGGGKTTSKVKKVIDKSWKEKCTSYVACRQAIAKIIRAGKDPGVWVKDKRKIEEDCKKKNETKYAGCVEYFESAAIARLYLNGASKKKTAQSPMLLIGGIIGGIIALLVIILIIYCCCCGAGAKKKGGVAGRSRSGRSRTKSGGKRSGKRSTKSRTKSGGRKSRKSSGGRKSGKKSKKTKKSGKK